MMTSSDPTIRVARSLVFLSSCSLSRPNIFLPGFPRVRFLPPSHLVQYSEDSHHCLRTYPAGMCTRPSEPRRDSRPMSPRPRRDRDVQNFARDETETIRLKSETRPRRDVAVSETLVETLKLARLSRVSGASTSCGDVFRDVW